MAHGDCRFCCRLFFRSAAYSFLLLACVTVAEEEAVSPAPESVSEPAVQESTDIVQEEEIFVASEELFVETFHRVAGVLRELNALISKRDFETWLEYLSDDYRSFYNDPEELATLSESRRLRSTGIDLESIEDFFLHVVVPSRANLTLDDLVFRSETEVEAIMVIQDQRISVYRLELIQGYWKIIR